MSKIYLSAAFSRRDEMAGIAYKMKFMGHTVTSRWITEDQSSLQNAALMDMQDVKKADTVVVFADSCYFTKNKVVSRKLLSCARMSELGAAIAQAIDSSWREAECLYRTGRQSRRH